VVSLPPVNPEEFRTKVIEQKQKDADAEKAHNFYCQMCRKKFNSDNAFSTHTKSKKHLQIAAKQPKENRVVEDDQSEMMTPDNDVAVERSASVALTEDYSMIDDSVDEDDLEDFEGLGVNECLFCCHWSSNMEKNLKHMTTKHSFYIPDPEYLSDIEGFITYLGVKVGADNECLKCGESGREFQSLEAVQKHMVDKGHCIINTEGDNYLEYSDYYDFSSSYPDYEMVEKDDVNPDPKSGSLQVDEDLCLVLPTGARVGHRSMKIYFKQNLSLVERTSRNRSARIQLLRDYRAIGWHGGEAGRVALKAEKREQMRAKKENLRLNVKANKFQTYFRPQVIF